MNIHFNQVKDLRFGRELRFHLQVYILRVHRGDIRSVYLMPNILNDIKIRLINKHPPENRFLQLLIPLLTHHQQLNKLPPKRHKLQSLPHTRQLLIPYLIIVRCFIPIMRLLLREVRLDSRFLVLVMVRYQFLLLEICEFVLHTHLDQEVDDELVVELEFGYHDIDLSQGFVGGVFDLVDARGFQVEVVGFKEEV